VGSRPIWNQHAYHVTNVDDFGGIPRASDLEANWLDPELNNFRQNVMGELASEASPDLTSRGESWLCTLEGDLEIHLQLCNRGIAPVGSGIVVAAYDDDPEAGGTEICRVALDRILDIGACAPLTCLWRDPPLEGTHDVYIHADVDAERTECLEGNNTALLADVACAIPG
jgi:hypothetical protein